MSSDALGRVAVVVEGGISATTTYGYDALIRVTQTIYNDGASPG